LEAFESALALEKFNNDALLKLHVIASEANDSTCCGLRTNRSRSIQKWPKSEDLINQH